MLLVIDAAPGDTLEQHIDRRLQIHHQIGLGGLDIELGIHLLVQSVLGIIERHAREQAILFQQVIRHAHTGEQILLLERGQLLGPLEQKVQLRG